MARMLLALTKILEVYPSLALPLPLYKTTLTVIFSCPCHPPYLPLLYLPLLFSNKTLRGQMLLMMGHQ